jgi:hypothetical protein
MYAKANVRPLFAVGAGDGNIGLALSLLTADSKARQDLLAHVNLLGTSARVDALARRYRTRWIYFGEASFYPFRILRLPVLRRNPHLQEVFQRGGIHVFKIDIPIPSE